MFLMAVAEGTRTLGDVYREKGSAVGCICEGLINVTRDTRTYCVSGEGDGTHLRVKPINSDGSETKEVTVFLGQHIDDIIIQEGP